MPNRNALLSSLVILLSLMGPALAAAPIPLTCVDNQSNSGSARLPRVVPHEDERDQVPQALDGGPSEPALHAERPDHEPSEAEPPSSRPGARPGFATSAMMIRPGTAAGALR